MRIISWNVNGLRACTKKGFARFLRNCKADVLCLQEVRAFPEQLDPKIRNPKGWHTSFFPAERPGYTGVAIYSRMPPDNVTTSLGIERFDIEGRFIMARFGRLSVASVYFPMGNGRDRDNSRVPYKLDFYAAVKDRIEAARKVGPVYVSGDYNTAHEDIDLARPKSNRRSSGFLPEERQVMTEWIEDGWVDVFRRQHSGEPGHYTWWRQFGNARQDNVGWRIDYVFASPTGAKRVHDAFIWPQVKGSDHCPVGIDLKPS